MNPILCLACGFPLEPTFFYCPHCGKKVSESVLSTSKIVGVVLTSLFLPPFGLIPGIKYVMNKNEKVQQVGYLVLGLTVISTIVTIWMSAALFTGFSQNVSSQLQQYQGLSQ